MQLQISWLLRSQLIWIYTVCKGSVYSGRAGQGLIQLWLINLLSSLIELRGFWKLFLYMYACMYVLNFINNKYCLNQLNSVGSDLRLNKGSFLSLFQTVCAYGQTHRGPFCVVLVFWLQITIESFALFHHIGFDYICFTDEVEDLYVDRSFHLLYSLFYLPFSGRRHKMTLKGWRVVKPQHNQSIICLLFGAVSELRVISQKHVYIFWPP